MVEYVRLVGLISGGEVFTTWTNDDVVVVLYSLERDSPRELPGIIESATPDST